MLGLYPKLIHVSKRDPWFQRSHNEVKVHVKEIHMYVICTSVSRTPLLVEISSTSIQIKAWRSNYNQDVITHPCPHFNGGLVKLPLKLGHGWITTVSKIRKKYLQIRCTSYFWALRSFQMFTDPLIQIKLHLPSTVLLIGFQSSMGALISNE